MLTVLAVLVRHRYRMRFRVKALGCCTMGWFFFGSAHFDFLLLFCFRARWSHPASSTPFAVCQGELNLDTNMVHATCLSAGSPEKHSEAERSCKSSRGPGPLQGLECCIVSASSSSAHVETQSRH